MAMGLSISQQVNRLSDQTSPIISNVKNKQTQN